MSSSAAMKDVPTLLIVGMGPSVHLLKLVHSHIRIGVAYTGHGAKDKTVVMKDVPRV